MKKIFTLLVLILVIFCNNLFATCSKTDNYLFHRNSLVQPPDKSLQKDTTGVEDVAFTMKL